MYIDYVIFVLQVSEFSKAVDVAGLSIIDDEVIVIGEWTVLCSQQQLSKCLDKCEVLSSTSSFSDYSDSEAEADSTCVARRTHTVTFKVIGCTKESQYQTIL